MPLSTQCLPSIRQKWLFKGIPSGFIYLGIKLTPGLKDIMADNILPILESTLLNWDKLGLFLLGKIIILKMMVVPRINYILYQLPIPLPCFLFKKYIVIVNTFLGGGKRPCLNRTKMHAAMENKGLNLPRLDHYALSLNQLAKMYISEDKAPT